MRSVCRSQIVGFVGLALAHADLVLVHAEPVQPVPAHHVPGQPEDKDRDYGEDAAEHGVGLPPLAEQDVRCHPTGTAGSPASSRMSRSGMKLRTTGTRSKL